MKRKNWLLLLTFAFVLSVLAACSGDNTDVSTDSKDKDGKSDEKVLNFINPEAIPSMTQL